MATKSGSVYMQACKIIKNNPNKMSFDEVFKELGIESLNATVASHITLALAWAQQAHKAYIRRR